MKYTSKFSDIATGAISMFLILLPAMLFAGPLPKDSLPKDPYGYWESQGELLDNIVLNSGSRDMMDFINGSSSGSIVALFNYSGEYRERQIRRSSDGGMTWEVLFGSEDIRQWFAVGHPEEDVIGAVGDVSTGTSRPVFVFSTDGGETFEKLRHTSQGGILQGNGGFSVSMYDAQNWAFTTQGMSTTYLYVTSDGGENWREEVVHYLTPLQVIMRSPTDISLFSGPGESREAGRMFISNDAGKSWESYPGLPPGTWRCFFRGCLTFTDKNTAFIGGGQPSGIGDTDTTTIYRTDDAGRTWERVFNQFSESFSWPIMDLLFANDQEAVAFTRTSRIGVLRTRDGGKTWFRDSTTWDIGFSSPYGVFIKEDSVETGVLLNKGNGWVATYKQTGYAPVALENSPEQEVVMRLYPVPTEQQLRVELKLQNNATTVNAVILDLHGKNHKSVSLNPGIENIIDVGGLSPGVYILSSTGNESYNFQKKFVVIP